MIKGYFAELENIWVLKFKVDSSDVMNIVTTRD